MNLKDYIIENSAGNLYWKNEKGIYMGCNRNMARTFGLNSCKEVIGKNDFDLFTETGSAKKIIDNDKMVMLHQEEQIFEEVGRNSKGDQSWYLSKKTPLKDDNGQIIGVLGTSIDITAQKAAEEREKTTLLNVIELAYGNIYWKNKEGRYIGCNKNQLAIPGFSSLDELIGKTDFDLYSKEIAHKIREIDIYVMESKKEQVLEEIGVNIQGKKAIYLTTKSPLFDSENNLVGIVGVSIDITQKKAAEEREKQLSIKEQAARNKANYEEQYRQTVMVLSGSIAHDLRTPIATLSLIASDFKKKFPELLAAYRKIKKVFPDEAQLKDRELDNLTDSVDGIQDILLQMNKFIDSTLKMLSQSGKLQLEAKDLMPCSINKCIQQTLSRYPFEEGQRKLIQWQLNGDNNFYFMGNEILMIRILFNLLKNALHQISKNKRGEIYISTEKTPEYNILKFRDTAIGVTPEILESLFIPYETTEAKGTGIGLAYCKHTMKNFNGDMTCNSKYGEYIEFVMKFPSAELAKDNS